MKRILFFVCMVLFLGSFVFAEYAAAARFVNNGNGTVTDTQTGLMWADQDNGAKINWTNAKIYCEGYSGGGKSGWRMPTSDELWQLYDSRAYGSVIRKTAYEVWTSREFVLIEFSFANQQWKPGYDGYYARALPVRSGK